MPTIKKRTLLIASLMLVGMLFLSGCRRSQEAPSADLTIALLSPSAQSMDGRTELQLQVTDASGQPVDNATLDITGDMTHAGMVPVQAETSSGTAGVYAVPFTWTMAGDWILTVRATLPDGRWSERQFDLTVSGGM